MRHTREDLDQGDRVVMAVGPSPCGHLSPNGDGPAITLGVKIAYTTAWSQFECDPSGKFTLMVPALCHDKKRSALGHNDCNHSGGLASYRNDRAGGGGLKRAQVSLI